MIVLPKSKLRAALTHAASKEVRTQLNGVHIEFTEYGDIHIVATDGNRMFCGLIFAQKAQWTDGKQNGPFRMTIPYDTVKSATKGKGDVILSALPNGRYSLGDFIFAPIDATFPDWRRVIPSTSRRAAIPGQYDWEKVADACGAVIEWHSPVKTAPVFHSYDSGLIGGSGTIGLMQGPDCTAFCVVMTWKEGDCLDPFRPCAYEAAKSAA